MGILALQKEVLKKHEAINTCYLSARKIVKHIKDSKLLYSLNRRVKQIQGHDGKMLDDGLETLRIYSHAGIELTWEDGIHALYAFTSEKRFDFVISSCHINHFAGLLGSSAVLRTKCIFEMYEQLISTSQKQFLLNVLLKYLPLYVLVVNSDEYIVNFHQTNCGEVVDQILKIDSNSETSMLQV